MSQAFSVLKQFGNLKGRKGIQKKKMLNKIIQFRPTLNVKVTVNANLYFERTFRKCDYLSAWV